MSIMFSMIKDSFVIFNHEPIGSTTHCWETWDPFTIMVVAKKSSRPCFPELPKVLPSSLI